MKKKKRVIIIIVVFFLVGLLLFLVLNKTNLLKLRSSIIDVKHGILKTYEIGDIVIFNPINYEICEDTSTSETCYKWLVIARGNNDYDLYGVDSRLSFKWDKQNPIDSIKENTKNWNNNLALKKYSDININENNKLTYKGLNSKMITNEEIDVLSNEYKSKLFIDEKDKPLRFVVVNNDNLSFDYYFYNDINKLVTSEKLFDFSNYSNQPNQDIFIKPLINLELSEKVKNSLIYEFDIYFIVDGSEYYKDERVEHYGSITKPSDPTKDGYTFKYWSLEVDGEEYDLDTPVENSLELFAVFEKNEDNKTQ
ncbi:MAG: InlB B-repeat-containing protein [Bacilli bacterium]|nr:InlB B-repeat-containing protein [Bacilli bacterium]